MTEALATGFWPLPYRPLVRFLEYWLARRGDRRCPDKADIDPIDIAPLVPDIYLLDAPEDGHTYRYRLAGDRVERLLGREVRGLTHRELHGGGADSVVAREVVRSEREYAWIARECAGAFRTTRLLIPDREHVRMARLTLPLSCAGGRARHLIAMMIEVDGTSPAGMAHFGIDLVRLVPMELPDGVRASTDARAFMPTR